MGESGENTSLVLCVGWEAFLSQKSGDAEDKGAAGHREQTWRQSGPEACIWMSWACLLLACPIVLFPVQLSHALTKAG